VTASPLDRLQWAAAVAADPSLHHAAKILAAVLACGANKDTGTCIQPLAKLAAASDLGQRTVWGGARELAVAGWLTIGDRRGRDWKVYRLNLERGIGYNPFPSESPSTSHPIATLTSQPNATLGAATSQPSAGNLAISGGQPRSPVPATSQPNATPSLQGVQGGTGGVHAESGAPPSPSLPIRGFADLRKSGRGPSTEWLEARHGLTDAEADEIAAACPRGCWSSVFKRMREQRDKATLERKADMDRKEQIAKQDRDEWARKQQEAEDKAKGPARKAAWDKIMGPLRGDPAPTVAPLADDHVHSVTEEAKDASLADSA
jgi:hypothetical protein